MSKDILDLAQHYTNKLQLISTAGKKPMSRSHIQKAIEKAKKAHALLRKNCDLLEADDAKTKTKLEDTKNQLNHNRQRMLSMYRGLQHMDLAHADDAVFYDDDDEIGYVIKGKEYHLEIDDKGDVTLTPMGKYRREQRNISKPEEDSVEEADEDNLTDVSDEDLMDYLHSSLTDDESDV